jgi:hypothetical protein
MTTLREHAQLYIPDLGFNAASRIFNLLTRFTHGSLREVIMEPDANTRTKVAVGAASPCEFRLEQEWETTAEGGQKLIGTTLANRTCGAAALEEGLRKDVPKGVDLSQCITPCGADCPRANIYSQSAQ